MKLKPLITTKISLFYTSHHPKNQNTSITQALKIHIEGTIFFFTSAECLESSLACVTIDLLSTIWHDFGRYNWEESSVNALLQPANTC